MDKGSTTQTDAEKREHLDELLDSFDTAMLVTRTERGALRSRPLHIADKHEGGQLHFAIRNDSGKVQELAADPHVNVVLQDRRRYVSLSGTARLVEDRALIDRLWSDAWKVWFPEGKSDPALCILAVDPEEAELWDQSGGKGLKYILSAAAAYVKGTTPATDDRQTARVRL